MSRVSGSRRRRPRSTVRLSLLLAISATAPRWLVVRHRTNVQGRLTLQSRSRFARRDRQRLSGLCPPVDRYRSAVGVDDDRAAFRSREHGYAALAVTGDDRRCGVAEAVVAT